MKHNGYVVYIVSSPCGKCYIGMTSNFTRRMYNLKNRSPRQNIHDAIDKFGWSSFKIQIIDKVAKKNTGKKRTPEFCELMRAQAIEQHAKRKHLCQS